MRAPNNLNALRAFESAARHLSYVNAADELNVTPAAVGQLVRGLEESLGVTLFHRSSSGPARLQLTVEARVALSDLQLGFHHLSAAVEQLKAGAVRRLITLTVPPAFADKWLLRRVELFLAKYPEYDLLVDTNGRIVNFDAEQVDVGIRFGAGRWPGLVATRLLSDDFFPVCSPELMTGAVPLQSFADLARHPLIHDASMRLEKTFPTWRSWLTRAGVTGIDVDRGLQITDSAAVIQATIAGGGVALGRSVLVADDLRAGRLVRPFGEAQSYEFAYFIVRKEDSVPSPAVVAFEEWLLEEAQHC